MSLLRTAAACVLASGVLLGGAWSGGAFALAPQGPSPRATGEPAYPHGSEIPVGDSLEVAGQRMRLSVFYTADPPQRVTRFYADSFRARGLLPVVSADAGLAHVAAFDPRDHLQRFINAVPQPAGQTLVIVGAIDRRGPASLVRGAGDASFPVPENHRAYLGFRSSDGAAHAESAQFVSALSPGAVAGFYRTALTHTGYRETTDTPGGSLLTFARDGAALSIALQKLDDGGGAAVFVTRSEGRPL
jgi:hypothetical protein